MVTISLYYWAGARAAAGVESERFNVDTVAQALAAARAARADQRFDQVLSASSLLVDGLAVHADDLVQPRQSDTRVEVLPPFAGGSGGQRLSTVSQGER
jgi:molybdopterin synthase sulfur carrier subunit